MRIKISKRNREFVNGTSLTPDVKQLILDKITECGGCLKTGKVPRGVFSQVAIELCLSNPVVSRIWKHYVLTGSVDHIRYRPQERLLSSEDEEYIRDLVQITPTLYKKEIRELVLNNTNSPITDISVGTIYRTVRHRLCGKQMTMKKTQRSNERRWTDANILYTRNFFNFIDSIDPVNIRFVDEASVNFGTTYRLYGSSESGTCALDISRHKLGPNYTIFSLVGLNDKCLTTVKPAPSDGYDFIEFIEEACTGFNNSGERIVEPGTVIITDCASVHSGQVQDILKPYLDAQFVVYYFLPRYSPDTNPCEEYFSLLKGSLRQTHFARIAEFSVPTAVLAAAETITPDKVYSFFRNATYNYMNL